MFWVYAPILLLLNAAWLLVSLAGIPGNWLMIGTVAAFDWWYDDRRVIHTGTWIAVIAIAVLGEMVELLAGAVGARRFGGSRLASVGALGGGLIGAVCGTVFIPVPLFGTVIGAALGAFCGATGVELMRGRPHNESVRIGRGAAFGHVTGNLTKFALGCVIWLILAVAVLNP